MKILYSELIGQHKDLDVCLQRIEDKIYNFRVDFAGNGHYFKTYDEAANYIIHRRFIPKKNIPMLWGA